MGGVVVDSWGAERIVAACRSGETLSSVPAKYDSACKIRRRPSTPLYHPSKTT